MMTTMSRRHFLALCSGAALASTLGTIRAANGQETIDEITWALSSVPETLFVPHAWSSSIGVIMSLVQEGPLLFGDNLTMVPGPAESWELTDPTTAVYHLRSGVTFSDGSPLTADDVVATVKYHLSPDSGSQVASFYSSLDFIEATDPATVTLKLKSPNAQFQYWAAVMAGFLFKKDQLANHDLGTPDLLPLGTGPYKLVEFVPAERAVLEARDDYWGGKPVIKKITIVAIPDEQTRILAMRNGDIDGTFNVSVSDIDQWKALGNVDVITQPSLGVYLLTLDQSAAPFDDIHVRKAISYVIDREGLVKALLKGNGEPATALNPPEMWTGIMSPDEVREFYATLPTYQYDLEKAKAELEQSEHPNGFEVTVPCSNTDPYTTDILQSVSANLKQIGITAKVQETDSWLAGYFRHENLGMQIMSYAPDFADPSNYPSLFFGSANARRDGMNASNFKNPEVDKALATANENSDPMLRGEALRQVFKIANEDAAVVPIFWPRSAMAISNKYKLAGYNAFWYNIPWAMRGFGRKA